MTLQEFFTQHPVVAMGFSGGVDSSYLLYEAKKYCKKIQPYFIQSQFQPSFELEDAKRLTDQLNIPLKVIHINILDDPKIAENTDKRCYYCKKAIFSSLKKQAEKDGYALLIDGSNASDDDASRPGMQALTELSVLSPLRECSLTKSDIRRLSKEAGLFTWNKPAYACLATRVPVGNRITNEILIRIEDAEKKLSTLGFSDFRVRILGSMAKLELTKEQMPLALEKRELILQSLKHSFSKILLDLNER